jgi:ankyrin repeat protein
MQELPPQPEVELIEGETLLIASRTGDAETLEAYIQRFGTAEEGVVGDRESLFDDYGDSVLHHSVQSGNNDCVEILLSYGRVQVDIPNVDNVTPLQLACRSGFGPAVQTLLQHNADPNHRDHRGITPFFAAVFSGAGTQLLELLCSASAEVSEQDNHGVSALHFAALKEDIALMEWLVLKGANVNAITELQTTPIMLSAKRGHLKGISLLLRANANTNTQDEAGCTALMLALSGDHLPCALALLSGMASVMLVDNAGRNALFYAIFSQNMEAVQGVVEKGARVNMLDEEGRSPLYQACLMGDRSIVLHLLEHDADPNLSGRGDEVKAPSAEDGEDAGEGEAVRRCLEEARMCLQACCVLEHNDLIGPLLEKKAQIDAAPGAFRWTALHLCAVMSNDEGAAKLVKHGAVGSLQDVDGNTAYLDYSLCGAAFCRRGRFTGSRAVVRHGSNWWWFNDSSVYKADIQEVTALQQEVCLVIYTQRHCRCIDIVPPHDDPLKFWMKSVGQEGM